MALYHPPCGCTRALDNLRHVIVEQQQFPPVQFSDGGEKKPYQTATTNSDISSSHPGHGGEEMQVR